MCPQPLSERQGLQLAQPHHRHRSRLRRLGPLQLHCAFTFPRPPQEVPPPDSALTGQSVSVSKLCTLIITYRTAREPSLVHLSGVLTGQSVNESKLYTLIITYRTARDPSLVQLSGVLTRQSVGEFFLYTLIITYRTAREPSLVHLSGVLSGQYCCVCCIVLLTLCIIILRVRHDHSQIAPCGMIKFF